MACHILLHEQDSAFREVLNYCLTQEGWEVSSFKNRPQPLLPLSEHPDVCVIDTDDEEGFRTIKYLTEHKDQRISVIAISERERIIDRVLGLELGCDDFIVKPFLPRELILRIRRILESREAFADIVDKGNMIQAYYIDPLRRTISFEGENIGLTSKEFELLLFFMKHKNMALSREQIIHSVWGDNYFGSDRVVDDLIRRIRKKVKHLRIETLYGYGYLVST